MKLIPHNIKRKIKAILGIKQPLTSFVQFWRGDQGFKTRLFLTNFPSHLLGDTTQIRYKFNVYGNNGNFLYSETRTILPQQSIDIEIYSERSPYGIVIVDCSLIKSGMRMVRQSSSLNSHFYVFYENWNNNGLGLVHTQTGIAKTPEDIDWYSSAILDEYDKVEILILNPSLQVLKTEVGIISDVSSDSIIHLPNTLSIAPKSCQLQELCIDPKLNHQRIFARGLGSPNAKPHIFAYRGDTFTVFHA